MTTGAASLHGATIVVVGATRGLGRQYAHDLAKAGAHVVVTGRTDAIDRVAADIRASGGVAQPVRCDVREPDAFVEAAMAMSGSIDGLVVNAGIVRDRSFAKMTIDEWREVIDVHLGGSFACAKAVWPVMTAQRRGAIVLTTSGAGLHGAFGQANYAAAKAGVIGLMKTLSIEGARLGIRANAIAPMASTDMTDDVFDAPMRETLRAEQVSPFLLALLDPCSTLTGAVVECGGGWGASMQWQRSLGTIARGGEIDEHALTCADHFDLPRTTAASLGAAMGRARSMKNVAAGETDDATGRDR